MTSRRPCWWSRRTKHDKTINFSPLGTKLYIHVNSARKIFIVLTFDIITFSHGCKPRITSYFIVGSIWPVTMPPEAYPWDLQFCLFLVVYSPPPRHAERDNSPSQSSWSTLYMCFGGTSFQVQNWFPSNFFKVACIILIKLALSYLLLVFCIITPRPSPCKKY